MTIQEVIDRVQQEKPNTFSVEDMISWISEIEGKIVNEVLRSHEMYDRQYDQFTGYSLNDLERVLIARFPYDRLYVEFVKMKIDEMLEETARYNNSAIMFNTHYEDFRKWYNKTHKPLHPNHIYI